MMRAHYLGISLVVGVALCTTPASCFNTPPIEQLMSVIFFDNAEAYQNPTPFFCNQIALGDADDSCKMSFQVLDPDKCQVEIVRAYRATYGQGKGREFLLERTVFTLGNIKLSKVSPPIMDPKKNVALTTLVGELDITRREGYEFSELLDDKGTYRACRINGDEKAMSEAECASAGAKPKVNAKEVPMAFSPQNYNRSLATVKLLQDAYCPMSGEQS